MTEKRYKITKPGVYNLPAAIYHADPCPTPSLSRSIAATLLKETAAHAYSEHSRLGDTREVDITKGMDFGSAAHAVMLCDDDAQIRIVQAPDFKSFAAKRARDEAHQNGQIPILQKHYEMVVEMVSAGRDQLTKHQTAYAAFLIGKPEQTIIWFEKVDGYKLWFRIRLDWLPPLGGWLDDYKTTQQSSKPSVWTARHLYPEMLDLQAALYLRGYEKVLGVRAAGFRYVVQEQKPPWSLSTVVLDAGDLHQATRNLEYSIKHFAWSSQNKRWPGHQNHDYVASRPSWREIEADDRDDQESALGRDGMFKQFMEWQKPL